MDAQRNIALMGRSGAGKTTVAEILVSQYGYHRCTPGDVCRNVCKLLFGTEDRERMNRVTDLLKQMDPLIWLKAAMANSPPGKPIVYDSMRFICDHEYLLNEGFEAWRIEIADALRHQRLKARGQEYTERDEEHALETELQSHLHQFLLNNDSDLASGELTLRIKCQMEEQAHTELA